MPTGTLDRTARLEYAVHRALALWHKDDVLEYPLATLRVVQRTADGDRITAHQASNQVLLSAIGILQFGHERDAILLRKRFIECKPSFLVANEFSVAESTFYNMQRQAIRRLTVVLQQMEQEYQSKYLIDFEAQAPSKTYDRLFGADRQLNLLRDRLLAHEPPWVVVLTGLGGIGKTALADSIARQLVLDERAFEGFAWISAQQQVLDPRGFIRSIQPTATTATDIAEVLARQLLPASAVPIPFSLNEALQVLHNVMRQDRHLVVIDNLETLSDLEPLLPLLNRLAGPTKFLLTSREALPSGSDAFHLSIPELSKSDSTKLVRHEASLRSLFDVVTADDDILDTLFDTVGGNPLALKLVVGQLCYLPLDTVLQNLREARGRKADELYRFIFWNSWRQLSAHAQSVLLVMPLFSTGGTELSNIERVSEVEDDDLLQAIEQLISCSLLNVMGDFRTRRYGIHRLTEIFLLHEVIKWSETGGTHP